MHAALRTHRAVDLLLQSAVLLLLVLIAGCSALHDPHARPSDLARQSLPVERSVGHPDSLERVRLATETDSVRVHLAVPYDALRQHWSTSLQSTRGGGYFEPFPYRTYATLQSRELTLAHLVYDLGLNDLSPELATRMIEREMQAYRERIVFDVHVFVSEARAEAMLDTRLDLLGADIWLEDGRGERHEPLDVTSHGTADLLPRRDAHGAYYRPNTLVFPRRAKGRDLLAESDRLVLHLESSEHPRVRIAFAWRIRPANPVTREGGSR